MLCVKQFVVSFCTWKSACVKLHGELHGCCYKTSTLSFQLRSMAMSSDVSEWEYDNSESESASTCTSARGHLSSPASQSQSPLKSSSDSYLHTTSQTTEESIVDQEGKWT